MSSITPATWRQLLDADSQSLCAELTELGERTLQPAVMSRLKAGHGVELLDAASELARARAKARSKFERVDRMLCDVQGVALALHAKAKDLSGYGRGVPCFANHPGCVHPE